jgi:hypothetical protein
VSEAQEKVVGDECSLANSMLVIVTLIAIDAELSRPEPLLWRGGLLPLGCEAAPKSDIQCHFCKRSALKREQASGCSFKASVCHR